MVSFLNLLVMLLPWPVKRWVLKAFYGYEISPTASIGLSYVFPKKLVMRDGSRIGHFNVVINIQDFVCDELSEISRGNWFTGHPVNGRHFRYKSDRNPSFLIGRHAAISKSHHFDCTDSIAIGEFTTVAGYQSQFITHGINVATSRQECNPISIGSYCMLGSRVTVLGGAALRNYSVLAAGSVLCSDDAPEYALLAGVPAKLKKQLDRSAKYFTRNKGFVD